MRVVLRSTCVCTTIASFLSNGVDVRPMLGCTTWCYVQQTCTGSVDSTAFEGAAWASCTSPPSPPPVPGGCHDDPLFPVQWHLPRTKVVQAWERIARAPGANVTVVVVDTGVDASHSDLTLDEASSLAWDVHGTRVAHDTVPVDQPHGTACAGVAAAIAGNGRGGCGIAHGVRLLSANLLGSTLELSDAAEADAFDAFRGVADVYSNSWGPADDGSPASIGALSLAALDGVRRLGRGGLGGVVVFAAGNGGPYDNANWDPYCAHPFTIAVGSVGDDDHLTYFSEPGACILLVAPSNGGLKGIVTTDLVHDAGYDSSNHTIDFSGTSASTPIVASAVALMLQVRPSLTWIDVQAILVASARRNDPSHDSWRSNAAGVAHSVWYGFGSLDVARAVELSEEWDTPLGPLMSANGTFATASADVSDSWSGTAWVQAGFHVTHVVVEYAITHPWKGHVQVRVSSPGGTASVLTSAFDRPDDAADMPTASQTTSMSMAFWGENGIGAWTMHVDVSGGAAASLRGANIQIYGVDLPVPPVPPSLPPPPPPPSEIFWIALFATLGVLGAIFVGVVAAFASGGRGLSVLRA